MNRVDFFLNHIIQSYDSNSDVWSFSFPQFHDLIHVDEKLFKIEKVRRSYILAPWEDPPPRSSHNKRFIGQLMFLCVVAKPRWDAGRNCWFDGKLGIWPFAELVPARRSSKNRPAGTPVLTAVSVTAAAYRIMLDDKVRPAIERKWPKDVRDVKVQQDNAPAHLSAGH